MKTNLTLSVVPTTVASAKLLAGERGTSVSAMFERFISMVAVRRRQQEKVGLLTCSVSGICLMPKVSSSRGVLEDALLDRHGLRPR